MEPLSILRDSIKAVPAIKYALAITGIVSAVAIIASLKFDLRIALLCVVTMIILMTTLVVFAKLTTFKNSWFVMPAKVLTWFSLLLIMFIATTIFSSVFFKYPVNLIHLINPDVSNNQTLNIQNKEKIDINPEDKALVIAIVRAIKSVALMLRNFDLMKAGKEVNFFEKEVNYSFNENLHLHYYSKMNPKAFSMRDVNDKNNQFSLTGTIDVDLASNDISSIVLTYFDFKDDKEPKPISIKIEGFEMKEIIGPFSLASFLNNIRKGGFEVGQTKFLNPSEIEVPVFYKRPKEGYEVEFRGWATIPE